ncbi:MAG: peptidoglycan DD-metalloendopeptidase family protein [bacterium]
MIKNAKIVFIVLSLFLLYNCTDSKKENIGTVKKQIKPDNEYLLNVNNLTENRRTVKPGENLTDLFGPFEIKYNKVVELADEINKVYSVKKFNFGKEYVIYTDNDSSNIPIYFVYEIDNKNYIVADLRNNMKVWLGKKEVTIVEHAVSGLIDYSLFTTINNLDLSDNLAFKLSEIFGWQIDFYAIQDGDYFSVVFEEEYVNGEFLSVGKILSAYFSHNKKDYYGFAFDVDDGTEYYDLDGNSLRRAFLKAPLKFSRISSKFTKSRFHPVLKIYRPHTGIDYAAAVGTPVQAVGDGVILSAEYNRGSGNYVRIKHNGTYASGYMHLSRYGTGIRKGTRVRQGDVIGYVGSTGLSTGPHLDFRFWINNQPANYLTLDFPSSNPIDKKYKTEFDKYKQIQITKLQLLDKPQSYEIIL